ncbi:tyrosine-type recombinase/integrase [Mitsuokella jalaludinii]|uniref:tyrosine-type recombinase/integrase n=1 Tax=Mitsuokella jalaludinii TaxID=187979 RepID=UPI003F95811F
MTNKKKTAPAAAQRTKGASRRADGEGSVYYMKSRGRWAAQFLVGISPTTGRPIRKYRYADTRREAVEALEEMRDKYRVVTHVDADTITTGEWLIKWFETFSKPRIRENTARSYRIILEIAIEEVGRIKLDKLTDIDLQAIIFGRLRHQYRTAQFFRTLMKAALRRAVKSRLIKESPAEDLDLPPKPPKKPFVKPSKEDWQKLLSYDKSPYYGWRWILFTEYVTGARMSEVLGLQWEDFTFRRDKAGRITGGTVHIQHALITGDVDEEIGIIPQKKGTRHIKEDGSLVPRNERGVFLRPTKTMRSNRVLPLPVDYCREMLAYRKVQLEHRMLVENFRVSSFVFTQWDGSPINPSSFSSRFAFVRKKLGIKTTFHMLRHDMASRMKSTHIFDLKDIQTQLGHSSIQITMDTYTHMDEDANEVVSKWLESGIDDLLAIDAGQRKKNVT